MSEADIRTLVRLAAFPTRSIVAVRRAPSPTLPSEWADGDISSGRLVQHGGDTSGGLLQPVGAKMSVTLGHGDVLVFEQILNAEEARHVPDDHACEHVPKEPQHANKKET